MTCVRGCVLPRHEPPCGCTADCPDHTGHCPGCQPAPAEHGMLCRACHRRITDTLGARECPEGPHGLPWMWDWIQPLRAPRLGNGLDPMRGDGDPPLPLAVDVIDLANAIRDTLASWTADLAERTGMTGPPDVRVATDTRPRGPDRLVVRRSATWLLRHVEALEGHWSVEQSYAELVALGSRVHALAPWRPAATLIDGVPCRCTATALHHHGDEVKCWACARSYTLEEYRTLTVVMARRFAAV